MAEETRTAQPRLNLEQRRAQHAWNIVDGIGKKIEKQSGKEREKVEKCAEDYARQAKKLPARILASGLGQALTFVYGKSDQGGANAQLLGDLAKWLFDDRYKLPRDARGTSPRSAIIEATMGNIPGLIAGSGSTTDSAFPSGSAFIRFATNEVLAYLVWLNRFLEAKELGKDDNQDTAQGDDVDTAQNANERRSIPT